MTIVINGFIYGAVAATLSAITMALKSPHAAYNAKMVSAPPIVLPFLCPEPVLASHRLVFTTATGKLRQPARNNKPEASQTVPFLSCFLFRCTLLQDAFKEWSVRKRQRFSLFLSPFLGHENKPICPPGQTQDTNT